MGVGVRLILGVEGGSILPNGAKTRKANSGARQRAPNGRKEAKCQKAEITANNRDHTHFSATQGSKGQK
jgi:hypothetical protein